MRAGCVEALRSFAARVGCGVVNTWGAKGVFPWDDPFHFGTAGLQARDFELAGLGEVEVLVTCGLDPAEVTSRPWLDRAEVIDVAPGDLADFDRSLPPGTLERPALYSALAAVVSPMYQRPDTAAARAAALAAEQPPSGVVMAAPGLVGFWVARTFPTRAPGTVVVPAQGDLDDVVRLARDGAERGLRVTVVTAEAELDLPGVRVQRWLPGEVDLDPAALVAVAGDIVAFGGAMPPGPGAATG